MKGGQLLIGGAIALFALLTVNQFKAGRDITGGFLNYDNRYFN